MSSDEAEEKECPLCMEPFELDDYSFFPCVCRYQICRFCWNRIRTEDDPALCPACRQPYPENPVNFEPLSSETIQKLKSEKRQKAVQQRNKLTECRKHLSAYRVLQKNLVYVVGLPAKVADPELLRKPEYFGKFGRVMKVAVGAAATTTQSSANSNHHQHAHQHAHTAYVTYSKTEDALKAIQAVNSSVVGGRPLKASLGTTKYCSSFMRGRKCSKQECMYLHEVADEELSFTKEDMIKGRHTEFERRLHEQATKSQQPNTKAAVLAGRTLRSTTRMHSESDNAPPGFGRRNSQPNGVESLISLPCDPHIESWNGGRAEDEHSPPLAARNSQPTGHPAITAHHEESVPCSFTLPTDTYQPQTRSNHQQRHQEHLSLQSDLPVGMSQTLNGQPPSPAIAPAVRPAALPAMMTCYELEQQLLLSASAPPGFGHCNPAPPAQYPLQQQPHLFQYQQPTLLNHTSLAAEHSDGNRAAAQATPTVNHNGTARSTGNTCVADADCYDDDDDIGFDPWLESSKGLADMLKEEQGAGANGQRS